MLIALAVLAAALVGAVVGYVIGRIDGWRGYALGAVFVLPLCVLLWTGQSETAARLIAGALVGYLVAYVASEWKHRRVAA